MLRFEERDDVTVQNPPSGEVVLFYTDGAFRIKDSAGEVTTITTVEGLEEVAETTEPKVYVALLDFPTAAAPTATIIKNTLDGIPVWTRFDEGVYRITLADTFTLNKTMLFISIGGTSADVTRIRTDENNSSADVIELIALNTSNVSVDIDTEGSKNIRIKIEVYP